MKRVPAPIHRFIAIATILLLSNCGGAHAVVANVYFAASAFSPENALLSFKPNGQAMVLNDDVPAFVGMITDGESLFVGYTDAVTLRPQILQFSLDGQYLDVFTNLPCHTDRCQIIALERDSAGNIYATTGNDDLPPYGDPDDYTVYRIRSNQGAELIHTTPYSSQLWGVDADAHGRIWVANRNKILRFSPELQLEATFPAPTSFLGALSIDEIGERLFLTRQSGEFFIYDISTDVPSLVDVIDIPETLVLDTDFDPWSGHLNVTTFAGGVELAIDGTIVSNFHVPPFSFGTGVASLAAGDFNNDGRMDVTDLDRLVAAIVSQSGGSAFDLNDDGVVTIADRDRWLMVAADANDIPGSSYLLGDANLDGFVNGQDFAQWNLNKFQHNASWSAGDFNADGVVDGLDFIVWNDNKFTSSERADTVPEPGFVFPLTAVVMGFATVRRHRLKRKH